MILHNIDDLELTIDKYLELANGGHMKIRCKFTDELEIGQSAYVGNSVNMIKRISEDEYMFIRKDGVSTHIDKFEDIHNLDKIYEEINKKLDYNLGYADNRVTLVKNLLDNNEWIYDLISSNRIMEKEVKKKTSFLAENQRYDQLIDSINTYITDARFMNKEDEEGFNILQQDKLALEQKGKRNKTKDDFDELNSLIDIIQGFHHKITKRKFQVDENNNTEFTGSLTQREKMGDFVYQEELKDRTKKAKFLYKKDEIPEEYWLKQYPSTRKELIPFFDQDLHNEKLNKSIHYYEFRPQILKQMKEEIDKLHSYLGLDIKDKQKRNEHIQKIKAKLEFMMWENVSGIKDKKIKTNSEIKYISGKRQYKVLRRMYTDLKADYEVAKKLLTDEFYFNLDKHSTVYDISSDTWYEGDNGEIVELSKNRVLMSNPNTYKGLILNYKDLRDKYIDKQDSDWWALIKDFEDVLNKTEFTQDEQFVLDVLFEGYSQKQIREMYKNLNYSEMTTYRVSNMINTIIPNKLLNTYLDSVQDWLVVNHQVGKYKVCTKCEESKLANERYFRKDSLAKDSLRSQCRKCESLAK